MASPYEAGPLVAAYEAHLKACCEASDWARAASLAAIEEALAPYFQENPGLLAVKWETSDEYDDQGGTYTSLSVRVDATDDARLRYEGDEIDTDDLEQVLHEHLWGTFRAEDLVACADEDSGVARMTRDDILGAPAS